MGIRHIILEGPDNAGKTTLAQELAKLTGLPVRGRITRVSPQETIQAHLDDVFGRCEPTILDRCYLISNVVYEPVNHPDQVSICVPCLDTLEEDLSHTALVVYVYADEDTLASRYAREGDDIQTLDNVLAAARGYAQYFADTSLPYINANTSSNKDVKELAQHIIGIYQGVKSCAL